MFTTQFCLKFPTTYTTTLRPKDLNPTSPTINLSPLSNQPKEPLTQLPIILLKPNPMCTPNQHPFHTFATLVCTWPSLPELSCTNSPFGTFQNLSLTTSPNCLARISHPFHGLTLCYPYQPERAKGPSQYPTSTPLSNLTHSSANNIPQPLAKSTKKSNYRKNLYCLFDLVRMLVLFPQESLNAMMIWRKICCTLRRHLCEHCCHFLS